MSDHPNPRDVIVVDRNDPLREISSDFVWLDDHVRLLDEARDSGYRVGFHAGRRASARPFSPLRGFARLMLVALLVTLLLEAIASLVPPTSTPEVPRSPARSSGTSTAAAPATSMRGGPTKETAMRKIAPLNTPTAHDPQVAGRAPTQLLTTEELAEHLGGIPPKTLVNWRSRRIGPTPIHLGRHVRYRLVDVEAWLAEMAVAGRTWMDT